MMCRLAVLGDREALLAGFADRHVLASFMALVWFFVLALVPAFFCFYM